MVQQNIGIADQVLRMVLGLVICSLAFIGPQTVWAWLGVILIWAGAFGFCPIYKILGICTAEKDHIHA